MNESDDAYEILGVSHDASAVDIKKAYRKLALKHHPDKQTTEEGREKAHAIFSKISNAYQILSDEETRRQYDIRKQCGTSQNVNSTDNNNYYQTADQQPMYTSYSTQSPQQGQHRTTFTSSGPRPQSKKTTYTTTTSTTYHTSSPRKGGKTTRVNSQRKNGGSRTADGDDNGTDNNFTFSFTSSDFNPKFDDPYEMFQKIFKKEYGRDFDPNCSDIPISPMNKKKSKSPNKSSHKTVFSVPSSTTCGTSPVQQNSKVKKGMSSLFASPKRKEKNQASTAAASPGPVRVRSSIMPTELGLSHQHADTAAPVSMSTKTRTVRHADGTQEIITETIITRADGSTERSMQSATSSSPLAPRSKSSSYKTIPMGMRQSKPGFVVSK